MAIHFASTAEMADVRRTMAPSFSCHTGCRATSAASSRLPTKRPKVDPDTAIGGPISHFPSTQLSLLEAATNRLTKEALDRVIALYWKPVYRFIRVKFHKNSEDAKDLTQSFFTNALQRDFLARFDPAKGAFRTYLRMAVERFAANEHAAAHRLKRGGEVEFVPVHEAIAT